MQAKTLACAIAVATILCAGGIVHAQSPPAAKAART